jgi:hypothetical protein
MTISHTMMTKARILVGSHARIARIEEAWIIADKRDRGEAQSCGRQSDNR